MIDREVFKAEWALLADRFNKQPDPRQQAAYYEFLNAQLTTEQFQAAAHSIWATAKWWPRPADFLMVNAAGEWATVIRCIDGFRGPDWPWRGHWDTLPQRAKEACLALGGMDALKAAYGKDPLRLKDAWEKAYEQATASEALALPPAGTRRLSAAS